MARLSSPISELKPHYRVVVVGSGYGGAIVTARLAQAGIQVCVLERGRELHPGEYPDTLARVLAELQVDVRGRPTSSPTGLYDLRLNDDINVFVGCGLGGTSLINANVAMWPDDRVFDDEHWPAALRDPRDPERVGAFGRAWRMLAPDVYPHAAPAKLEALERCAEGLRARHPGATATRPALTVTFKDGPNAADVHQRACRLCGDCVSGCNYEAKNTLLMNYLPLARRHRAEIYTGVAVRRLERRDGAWVVRFEMLDSGQRVFGERPMRVTAEHVVLAAGTLGSTEILLRSQSERLRFSPKLGGGFTGNGDVLAFAWNSHRPVNGVGAGWRRPDERDPVGPCITGAIDLRARRPLADGVVIQEGAIPGAAAATLPLIFAVAALFGARGPEEARRTLGRDAGRVWRALLPTLAGAHRYMQTFLVMGHDDAGGEIYLDPRTDRPRIRWANVAKQPVFETANRDLRDASRALESTFLPSPFGLTTVHPLGGCGMGPSVEDSVVDHEGAVYSPDGDIHAGLYVCDGSIIPRPLGVNPLLTIAILAEYLAGRLVRRLPAKRPRTPAAVTAPRP